MPLPRLHFRPRSLGAALLATAALLLSACAQDRYYAPSDTTASPKSGVTVYGEIDTSVVRTR